MGGIRFSGLNSGMDTEAMINKIMDAERMKLKKIDDKKTTLTWKQEKWKDLNTKLYSLYTKHISKMRFEKAYNTKVGKSTDEGVATVTTESNAAIGKHTLKVTKIAQSSRMVGTQLSEGEGVDLDTNLMELGFQEGDRIAIKRGSIKDINISAGNNLTHRVDAVNKEIEDAKKNDELKLFEIKEGSTVKDFLNELKSAGLDARFDTVQRRFFISSKASGNKDDFSLEQIRLTTGNYDLKELKEGEIVSGVNDLTSLGLFGAKCEPGQDAEYEFDGIMYTSDKNTNTINGININLEGKAGAETVINVTSSVDDLYKNFKGFIKEYNSILKEMNDLYYADYNKNYKPLSKEQKEKMSEKEIEDWEKKIKESLLRRDDSLAKVIRVMRNSMQSTIAVNNKNYSLSAFGVMSSDYKEKGLLHIYGDEEDGVFASKTDKFKKLFTDDPEAAAEALQGIMSKLYSGMTDAMKGTRLSSSMTFYKDKEMTKLSLTYKKEYKDMEDKLNKIEDKYYKQFVAMEKAMSKLNNQTNTLANMLGR